MRKTTRSSTSTRYEIGSMFQYKFDCDGSTKFFTGEVRNIIDDIFYARFEDGESLTFSKIEMEEGAEDERPSPEDIKRYNNQ